MVVRLGMGPTMNAWTSGPMDTVANDAWAGTLIRDRDGVRAGGEFLVQNYS